MNKALGATELLLLGKAINKYYNEGRSNYIIGNLKEEIISENGEIITPYKYYTISIKRDYDKDVYYLLIDNKRCSIYDIFKTSLIEENN